jgi:hypothetical protein
MEQKMQKKHFVFTESDIAEGKYAAWDLIQPLWYNVNIYDGFEEYNRDLEAFTEGQRKILALLWYEAEVCNGGHDQFFFNSTGIVWKDAIEGMHMIGAKEIAANFQKAIDMFGGEVPFDRDERGDMLDELSEKEDFDDFEEIDSFYYENDELSALMYEYVKSHPAEFVVDGEYDYFEVDM